MGSCHYTCIFVWLWSWASTFWSHFAQNCRTTHTAIPHQYNSSYSNLMFYRDKMKHNVSTNHMCIAVECLLKLNLHLIIVHVSHKFTSVINISVRLSCTMMRSTKTQKKTIDDLTLVLLYIIKSFLITTATVLQRYSMVCEPLNDLLCVKWCHF